MGTQVSISTSRGGRPEPESRGLTHRIGATATAAAFSHVALSVSDLERSLAFYRDGLSCEAGKIYHASGGCLASLMRVPSSGLRGVFLRYGQAHLELLEYVQRPELVARQRDPREIGYAHISFIVPDVGKTASALVARGGVVVGELRQSFGGSEPTQIAFVTDPDVNRIELISHPHIAEERAHAQFLGGAHLGWPATTPAASAHDIN